MNNAFNNRLLVTKAVLWFLFGAASVIMAVRFAVGMGPTTALTDLTPWGMWTAFKLAGIALAAAGFVVAGIVHVFHLEFYHRIARRAVLMAFLGYVSVIVALVMDLGRPWNIWRPIVFQNLHSPLFEVAMCVIFYTTVLALEFAPVGLEPFRAFAPVVRFLRKATVPIVIVGICLSCLHQSSLGTLFLLSEVRMHPLWYSPLLPPLFLISAIGMGLSLVTLEGLVSAWLYRREPEWPQLRGLTRAASVVLLVYLAFRLGDLGWRGQLGRALDGSRFATLFWIEVVVSVLAPAVLFRLPERRGGTWALRWGTLLAVAGFILQRAGVGGISHIAITREFYVPALTELFISFGLVSGFALLFLFFVERLTVWEEPPGTPDRLAPPAVDPVGSQFFGSPWFGGGQRAAFAAIAGAVLGLALVDAQIAQRRQPRPTPVDPPRSISVRITPRADAVGNDFEWLPAAAAASAGDASRGADPVASVETVLLLDGGGTGRFVPFPHDAHRDRLGGDASCVKCHHRNVALDRGTSCVRCHRDMYRRTDTFDHAGHVTALRHEKDACVVCHADRTAAKDRAGSRACDSCHQPVPPADTFVHTEATAAPGMAPGYQRALHSLCIDCHRKHEETQGVTEPALGRCTACHRLRFEDEGALRSREEWPAPIPSQVVLSSVSSGG